MGNKTIHAILFLCVVLLFCIGPAVAENTDCESCGTFGELTRGDHPDLVTPAKTTTSVEIVGTCDGFTNVANSNSFAAAGAGRYTAQTNVFKVQTNVGSTALNVATGFETQNSTVLTVATREIDFAGTSASVKDSFFLSRCGDGDLSYCEEVSGGSSAGIQNGAFASNYASISTPDNGMSVAYEYANGPTATSNAPPGMVGEIRSHFDTLQQYGSGSTLGANYETAFSSHMSGVSTTGGRFVFNTLQEV